MLQHDDADRFFWMRHADEDGSQGAAGDLEAPDRAAGAGRAGLQHGHLASPGGELRRPRLQLRQRRVAIPFRQGRDDVVVVREHSPLLVLAPVAYQREEKAKVAEKHADSTSGTPFRGPGPSETHLRKWSSQPVPALPL